MPSLAESYNGGEGWSSDQQNRQHANTPYPNDDSFIPPNPDPDTRYTYNTDRFPPSGDGHEDEDYDRTSPRQTRNRWTTPMSAFAQDDVLGPPPLVNAPQAAPIRGYVPPFVYQYPTSYYSAQTAGYPGTNPPPAFVPLRSPGRTDAGAWPELHPSLDQRSTGGRQQYPASPYPYDRRAFSNNALDERTDGEWDAWPAFGHGTPATAFNGEFGFESPSPTLVRSASAMGSGFGYGFENGLRTGPRPRHKRPEQWREDYRPPRNGWAKLFGAIGRRRGESGSFSRNILSFMGVSQLHSTLTHRSPAPMAWDLRLEPNALRLIKEKRQLTFIELGESATEPPSDRMRIVHEDLPWYLTVEAPSPSNSESNTTLYPQFDQSPWTPPSSALPHLITISHLLWTIFIQLRQPIVDADFYAEGLTQWDRERISKAWSMRCMGDEREGMCGVRRVDYLGEKFILEGFVKKKEGVWEMKTRRKEGRE